MASQTPSVQGEAVTVLCRRGAGCAARAVVRQPPKRWSSRQNPLTGLLPREPREGSLHFCSSPIPIRLPVLGDTERSPAMRHDSLPIGSIRSGSSMALHVLATTSAGTDEAAAPAFPPRLRELAFACSSVVIAGRARFGAASVAAAMLIRGRPPTLKCRGSCRPLRADGIPSI